MHMTSWSRNTQGYVLVIVMGLLAALGVMALCAWCRGTRGSRTDAAFSGRDRGGVVGQGGYRLDHTLSQHGGTAGDTVASALDEPGGSVSGALLRVGTFDVQYTDPDGTLHYGLQDEEARVNLNTAPVALLAALPGVGTELAEAIVKHRQQGPWGAPEDLLHRGLVSPPVWYGSTGQAGLSAYLTVWGSGKININTASPVVVTAVPGMTPALVEAMVRYRQGDDQQLGTSDDRYFRTVADLRLSLGVDRSGLERAEAFLTVMPSAFRLIATGVCHMARARRVHIDVWQ